MALDIVRVNSVRAAAAVLAAEEGARFLGGGTLLVRAINSGFIAPTRLVLSDGLGLDRIDIRGGEVELGAAVTMAEIAAHPQLSFLRPVAVSIGGPAVRAMATVGGNLFARYPYGDFAVALLALDAEISSEDLDGTAVVPLGDFLAMPAGNRRRIVRSIRFQLPADGAFRYAKIVRKKPHGASVISIAANLPVDGGKLGDVRIAYGAMAPRPIRASAVEKALSGRKLDDAAIAAAVEVAAEGCAPESDPQASAWYRLTVLPVHLKRLLSN